jgi:hypothetical protein
MRSGTTVPSQNPYQGLFSPSSSVHRKLFYSVRVSKSRAKPVGVKFRWRVLLQVAVQSLASGNQQLICAV